MIFQFFVQASNSEEMHDKIRIIAEHFFPSKDWNYQLIEVCQLETVPEEKVKKTSKGEPKILFQVKIEIYQQGLKNALVKTNGYST